MGHGVSNGAYLPSLRKETRGTQGRVKTMSLAPMNGVEGP